MSTATLNYRLKLGRPKKLDKDKVKKPTSPVKAEKVKIEEPEPEPEKSSGESDSNDEEEELDGRGKKKRLTSKRVIDSLTHPERRSFIVYRLKIKTKKRKLKEESQDNRLRIHPA